MGRRHKTHLVGPSQSGSFVSKVIILSGLLSLLLLYLCTKRDGLFSRKEHGGFTEEEMINLLRSERENEIAQITRSSVESHTINVLLLGKENIRHSGFHDLSETSVQQAIDDYNSMPNVSKSHSVFFLHSYDLLQEADLVEDASKSCLGRVYPALTHLQTTEAISADVQVYDETLSTQETDLLKSMLKLRMFISSLVYVRLELETPAKKKLHTSNLRNKLLGSKIKLNVYVADFHAELYHDTLIWLLELSPSLDNFVTVTINKISSEKVTWESEKSFKRIIHRAEMAMEELKHFKNIVRSLEDAQALALLGGKNAISYL